MNPTETEENFNVSTGVSWELICNCILYFIPWLLYLNLYIVVHCMLYLSELKKVDYLVFWHMQGLAIQNGYLLLIIRLSTQAMVFCQKVLHLLKFVRMRVLHSLDLQHLLSGTWVIKGTDHFLSYFFSPFFLAHFYLLLFLNLFESIQPPFSILFLFLDWNYLIRSTLLCDNIFSSCP